MKKYNIDIGFFIILFLSLIIFTLCVYLFFHNYKFPDEDLVIFLNHEKYIFGKIKEHSIDNIIIETDTKEIQIKNPGFYSIKSFGERDILSLRIN